MSAFKNGGPAFPQERTGNIATEQYGMTLRDYFAAQALAGVIEVYRYDNGGGIGSDHLPHNVAAHVYRIADAMLAERKKDRA